MMTTSVSTHTKRLVVVVVVVATDMRK
jgi:hypothetical protein